MYYNFFLKVIDTFGLAADHQTVHYDLISLSYKQSLHTLSVKRLQEKSICLLFEGLLSNQIRTFGIFFPISNPIMLILCPVCLVIAIKASGKGLKIQLLFHRNVKHVVSTRRENAQFHRRVHSRSLSSLSTFQFLHCLYTLAHEAT